LNIYFSKYLKFALSNPNALGLLKAAFEAVVYFKQLLYLGNKHFVFLREITFYYLVLLIFELFQLASKRKKYFMNLNIWNFVFYVVLFINPLLFNFLYKFFEIIVSLILSSLNKLFVNIDLYVFILFLYFIILSTLV